jgi:hypothetical protein
MAQGHEDTQVWVGHKCSLKLLVAERHSKQWRELHDIAVFSYVKLLIIVTVRWQDCNIHEEARYQPRKDAVRDLRLLNPWRCCELLSWWHSAVWHYIWICSSTAVRNSYLLKPFLGVFPIPLCLYNIISAFLSIRTSFSFYHYFATCFGLWMAIIRHTIQDICKLYL